jgi:hypothetical protein
MERVSYHQNVFDLLGVERHHLDSRSWRGFHPEDLWRCLPASVREWYGYEAAVPGVGRIGEELWRDHHYAAGHLWHDFSDGDHPWSLACLCEQLQGQPVNGFSVLPDHLYVLTARIGGCNWLVERQGDDPVVWRDNGSRMRARWTREGPFSDFLFRWFALFYRRDGTPLSGRKGARGPGGPWAFQPKKYLRGVWLRAPREQPLAPPLLDLLLDSFEEEPRPAPADGPATYRFRGPAMTLTVTTDAWDDPAGHSAWWLHAETPPALEELARRIERALGPDSDLRAGSAEGEAVLGRLRATE